MQWESAAPLRLSGPQQGKLASARKHPLWSQVYIHGRIACVLTFHCKNLAQRLPWKQEISECIEKKHGPRWTNDNFLSWEIKKSQNDFVKIFMSAIIYMKLLFGFWIAELISGSQTRDLSFPSADNIVLPGKSSCALNLGWNFLQVQLLL